MRDNHKGMAELIDAFEKDELFYAVILHSIEGQTHKFQFGVSRKGYGALKRTLAMRPFDNTPGIKYRHFLSSLVQKRESDLKIGIRIEQGKNGKGFFIDAPRSLAANLKWFYTLRSLEEAEHLLI